MSGYLHLLKEFNNKNKMLNESYNELYNIDALIEHAKVLTSKHIQEDAKYGTLCSMTFKYDVYDWFDIKIHEIDGQLKLMFVYDESMMWKDACTYLYYESLMFDLANHFNVELLLYERCETHKIKQVLSN